MELIQSDAEIVTSAGPAPDQEVGGGAVSLRDEIQEQPAVLSRLLQSQAEATRRIARSLRKRGIHSVVLAARGTSHNAGLYAKYLWGAYNRLPVAMAAPSLVSCYHRVPALANTLVVGVSQSGESPDIVGVVEEGRRQGLPTLAITNAVDSPLAQSAELVLDISAGEERRSRSPSDGPVCPAAGGARAQ